MKRLFLFFLLFLPFFLISQIQEIKTLSQIYPHLKKQTLVVFDLDNTLLEPVQDLGSDQWFDSKRSFYKKKGFSSQVAFEKTYDEYYKIQSVTEVRLIEKDTLKVFEKAAEKNQIMALTTRDDNLSYATIKQLGKLKLIFKKPPVAGEAYVYTDRGLLYREGIFFTAGAHKGRAFLAFLKKTGLKPKAVLFINDKLDPLKEMEEACLKNQIAFTGLRYGYLDEKVKKLNHRILEKKPLSFSKVLLEMSKP